MTRCLARHSHASPCRDEVKGQDRVVVCSSHLHTHRPPRWKGHLFFLGGGGRSLHISCARSAGRKNCVIHPFLVRRIFRKNLFIFFYFFECDACNSVALRVARLLRIREYGNNKRASNFRSCLVPFFFFFFLLLLWKSLSPPCLFFFS